MIGNVQLELHLSIMKLIIPSLLSSANTKRNIYSFCTLIDSIFSQSFVVDKLIERQMYSTVQTLFHSVVRNNPIVFTSVGKGGWWRFPQNLCFGALRSNLEKDSLNLLKYDRSNVYEHSKPICYF